MWDSCLYQLSPIKLISSVIQRPVQSFSRHHNTVLETSEVAYIEQRSCFALHENRCWSNRETCTGNKDTTTCASPPRHAGLFDLCSACSLCSQTKHDGWTLKVELSVRRRWSWKPLTPSRIGYKPLSQVQDYIIRMSGGEVGERLKGCRGEEGGKRIVNELQW